MNALHVVSRALSVTVPTSAAAIGLVEIFVSVEGLVEAVYGVTGVTVADYEVLTFLAVHSHGWGVVDCGSIVSRKLLLRSIKCSYAVVSGGKIWCLESSRYAAVSARRS